MTSPHPTPSGLAALLSLALSAVLSAAEVRVIEPGHEPIISGKELDWIYGDYLMKNDHLSLVIAAPLPTRDANMTIRNIGGSILDLTLNHPSNDQLSAYTPTAGRYLFHDSSKVTSGRDGDAVFWQCRSSRSLANDGTTATVRYRLGEGNAFVESTVWIEGNQAGKVGAFDGVRADGWFSFEESASTAYCIDSFFRQTIGFKIPAAQHPPNWKQGRPYQLRYADSHVERSDGIVKWTVLLYPATSLIDLISAAEKSDLSPAMQTFRVLPETQPGKDVDSVNRAKVMLRSVGEQGEGSAATLHVTDGRPRRCPRQAGARKVRRRRLRDRIRRRGSRLRFDSRRWIGEVAVNSCQRLRGGSHG